MFTDFVTGGRFKTIILPHYLHPYIYKANVGNDAAYFLKHKPDVKNDIENSIEQIATTSTRAVRCNRIKQSYKR